MQALRNLNPIDYTRNQDIIFQCIEWVSTDETKQIINKNPKCSKKFNYIKQHVIKIFGVTKEGYSVSVNNNNFKPYFFIKIDENFTNLHKIKLVGEIKKKLEDIRLIKAIISVDEIKRKDFYGFNNEKLFRFLKFTFENSCVMKKVDKILKEGVNINNIKIKYPIYESNISPFIRFIHTKKLKAAGWVKIPAGKFTINRNKDKTSQCQIDIDINYNDIIPIEYNSVAPLLIASFDIECSSSHGDFPLAKKNYKKLGCEIYDNFKKIGKITKMDNKKQRIILNGFLEKAFTKSKKLNIDDISYVFTKDELVKDYDFKLNLEKISLKILYVIKREENYKILANEVLKYFFIENVNDINSFTEKYKNHIVNILTDSFIPFNKNIYKSNRILYGSKKNRDILVETIYTKTNKKPSKRIIEIVALKTLKQILLLFVLRFY